MTVLIKIIIKIFERIQNIFIWKEISTTVNRRVLVIVIANVESYNFGISSGMSEVILGELNSTS